MQKTDPRYAVYLQILRDELVPAMGCTEPVAIALACAKARDLLGGAPERARLWVSGNIIKNVKSVVVPGTGGGRGIATAAAIGFAVGDAGRALQVISAVTDAQRAEMARLLKDCPIEIAPAEGPEVFDILVEAEAGGHRARVRITGFHTNIVLAELDGRVLEQKQSTAAGPAGEDPLTVEGILDFASTADLDDVRAVLDRQIAYNTAIRDEGLTGRWGAAIGCTLLRCYGNDVAVRARAAAAAGSDARMSGCTLPVIINSGSGNQGITVSMPVILYANHIGASHEKLLRALCVSNMMAIHQKTGIGRLSAFCGAVSAATGAACGIAWLDGAEYDVIAQTITNSLANVGGMVCDGAKSSCAAKIASSLESALLGYELAKEQRGFHDGEGIVKSDVEKTIASVGRMAAVGMHSTDQEILHIMVDA